MMAHAWLASVRLRGQEKKASGQKCRLKGSERREQAKQQTQVGGRHRKPARTLTQVSRRLSRPEEYHCTDGQNRLHRAVTLSERTVLTWEEVITRVHAGYRCPDPHGVGYRRTDRSGKADALALPWFTSGLDVVLLVGPLRLPEHQTVDEIHHELLRRVEPLGVKIARREIRYRFEASCTLLRARSEAKNAQEWLAQGEKKGGEHRLRGWHAPRKGE
jgi:hypothetical protein